MKKTKTLTAIAILTAVSSIAAAYTPQVLSLINPTNLTSTAITTSILLTSPAYMYLLIKKH